MRSVVLITADLVLRNRLERLLTDSFRVVLFSSLQSSLDYVYSSMPDLMVVESKGVSDSWTKGILNDLKNDPIFGQIPIMVITEDDMVSPNWHYLIADDYVRKSSLEAEISARVGLCIERSARFVEINPLTRLPGNIAILKQIQNRLDSGEVFAVAWADLDDFKPFNDKYGFARGDEVLKMVGRLILNTVKEEQPSNSFVGHIGGDDFVFIVKYEAVGIASEKIIKNFDGIISIFYDEQDRMKGYIESSDRSGNSLSFPIMSISIGVAHNKFVPFSLSVEITEIASEMKRYSKLTNGSCYKVDKRTSRRG
ncbi:MAG TPA: diguanylate cyclase [Syntrophorhabdales bacterium]|nr:diguanylate cyclase [Syntrophorhabdales bacterium]